MSNLPLILLSPSIHHNKEVVFIRFKYNTRLIEITKSISGAKWSQSNKCWYLLKEDFNLNHLFNLLSPYAYIDYSAFSKKQTQKPAMVQQKKVKKEPVKIPQSYFDKLDIKRYSENTKKVYINYFGDFIRFFKNRELDSVSSYEINEYILTLIREERISISQQNQRINAIKFYYEKVMGADKTLYSIDRPKKKKQLPNVLSTEEVKLMINQTTNIKHKCIVSLLYSAGLRRSELINMKVSDILSDQMLIKIRNSKGNKDRYVGLSNFQLELLRAYYKAYKPKIWLFEGQDGNQYSVASLLKVVKTAAKKACIKRRVTPHMLRHSFATHHLENGTNLRYIQEFLGHHSSKTTEVYTHVAKTDFKRFKNPLDEIYDKSK